MRYTGLSFGGISPVFRGDVTVPIAELGDAPLVAVVGENGEGKTTMLEVMAASWSRWLASRGALAGSANRCNSFVQSAIDMGDHEYTTKQMIDGVARKTKTEAYLSRDGKPLSKKGPTDFDEQVAKYFPSRDFYFMSGFAAQGGKGRFLDSKPAKRKEIFGEMTGGGRLQLLSDAAGEKARATEKTITGLRGKESQLEEQAERLDAAQDDLTAAELNHAETFADLLRVENAAANAREQLEVWHSRRAALAEAASAARSALERARRELGERQREEDRLGDELAKVSAKRAKLEDQLAQRGDLESAVAAIDRDQGALADAKEELARLRRQQDEHRSATDAWRVRRDEAAQRLSEAETELREAQDKIDSEHREAVDAWHQREREAQDRLRDAERALERAQDKITQAHREEVSEWRERREDAERYLRDAEFSMSHLNETGETNLAAGKRDLDRAEKLAAGLSSMPCGGEGKYVTCELLTGAVQAREDVPGLRERVDGLTKRLEDDRSPDSRLGKLIAKARADLDAIPTDEPTAPDTDTEPPEASVARRRAVELSDVERNKPAEPTTIPPEAAAVNEAFNALAAVDREEPAAPDVTRIPALEELAERIVQRLTAGAEARAKLEQLERVVEQAAGLDTQAADIRAVVAGSRAALSGLEAAEIHAIDANVDAAADVNEHDNAKPTAPDDAELTSARDAVAAARDRQTTAKAAVDAAEKATADLDGVRGEIASNLVDLDDWKHLQKVLGRDGVQALLIDAAAPEVSELANQLLHACYGSRFTVELKTAVLKADGKSTKEDFDLHVIDTVDGTEGSASLKSGGQKVLISEALSLAIAIYNARQSSIPIEDLVRDECAGALSSGQAVRYIEMLRKALDLGDFHRCYFVAHQPHLWDLADARLLVANGDVTIADAGEIEISAQNGEEAA